MKEKDRHEGQADPAASDSAIQSDTQSELVTGRTIQVRSGGQYFTEPEKPEE